MPNPLLPIVSHNVRSTSKRLMYYGCGGLIMVLLTFFAAGFVLLGGLVQIQANACGTSGGTTTGGGGGTVSATQLGYARMIIGVGKTMNMGTQGEVIALMVALDESGLKEYANSNVPLSLTYPHDAVGSDHGSVGIFQQQVNPDGSNFGWGTLDQLMNATDGTHYQAYRFYAALQGISGWQTMQPWVAAQAVQRSAFSSGLNYYAFLGEATNLVNANQDAPAVPLPSGATSPSQSGSPGTCPSGNATTQAIQTAASALDALNWMYCQPAAGYSQPSVYINYPGNGVCRAPGGMDCAGTVAYVLQHGGMTNFVTGNSTSYLGLPWQKLGSGMYPYSVSAPGVQLYTSNAHTFLVIAGRVFSSDTLSLPTGGPHWRTWNAGAEESGDGAIQWTVFQVPGTT